MRDLKKVFCSIPPMCKEGLDKYFKFALYAPNLSKKEKWASHNILEDLRLASNAT